MTKLFENWLTRIWDWVDTRGVIRRGVLGVIIWMNWAAGEHAYEYALTALAVGKTDAGVGAVIAAFTAPAALLAGYVFKSYVDTRS
jgi:hypothetical protein